ncbi:hypothetical protein [Phosphitispora sp. TUW77]|uniref:hypothetical protein n=1 Tax=Phosphitispora sp. TUW77 TaxID=3152361 RepID=UPI003AB23BEF
MFGGVSLKDPKVKTLVSVTSYELINFMYNTLTESGWKSTFNYSKRSPTKFVSKTLEIPQGSISGFNKYFNYCYLFSRNFKEKDEAARYSKNNGTSIYFSVVLYWLLVYFGVLDESRLKLCQGYFSYRVREDKVPQTRYRAGLHAWLSYNCSVIDTTIWQQEELFDFQNYDSKHPVITGNIPRGMTLIGFEENKSLAKEYARNFARDSKLTFCEWVIYHKQQADLLYNNSLHLV